MAKSPGSAYKRWVLALVLTCAAAGSVIIGSMLLKDGRLKIPFLAGAASAVETPVRVVYVTEFLKCGDELAEVKSSPRAELPSLLAAIPPEWAVAKNNELGVELRHELDDYCQEHLRFRLIALYRGYICVYRGKEPNPAFLVKERPDIRDADLVPRDREHLARGVLIEAAPDIVGGQVAVWLDEQVAISLEGITEH